MAEEKVEMADVPLTAAVDGEHTTEGGEDKEEGEKKKVASGGTKHRFSLPNPFARKHVGTETSATATGGVGGAEEKTATVSEETEGGGGKKKRCHRWWPWTQKGYEQVDTGDAKHDEQSTIIGLSLIDRDEKNINDCVKLSFEDVLAEPDSAHSLDCTWRLTHRVFTNVHKAIYRLLALVFALPCAIVWALILAILTALHVWVCTPLFRVLSVPFDCLFKVWSYIIRSLFDPCFHSASLFWNSMQLRRTNLCLTPQVCP